MRIRDDLTRDASEYYMPVGERLKSGVAGVMVWPDVYALLVLPDLRYIRSIPRSHKSGCRVGFCAKAFIMKDRGYNQGIPQGAPTEDRETKEATGMAMHRTRPGEIFDLAPLGSSLKGARTTAIVKSEMFEAARLIVHAGIDIKTHKVEGPITLHCLEGRALLILPDTTVELSGGQWLYLDGGVPHAIRGIEDTSLLLTILFPLPSRAQVRGREGSDPKSKRTMSKKLITDLMLDSLLDEGLMGTFPASDPVSISNPSTGVRITRHDH